MGNIVGEPFKDYVKTQINRRQKINGKKTRNSTEISYLNSRTSWIKLVSGTKIEQSRLDMVSELKTQKKYLGLGLASNFILFNGTRGANVTNSELEYQWRDNTTGKILPQDNGNADYEIIKKGKYSFTYDSPKAGILGNSLNPAYGMTGNTDFGLVPMPGIENVSVKALERGSIKRASIRIKAYNKLQFDIIDILYLRLGYTVLLEWGDSHYINNGDGEIEKLRTTLVEKEFFKTSFSTDYYNLLDTLEDERKNYSGCYDALIGKISNFKWTFNPDGTYSINLDIISLGDVIESLKLNVAPYTLDTTKNINPEEEESIIDSNRDSNELSKMFYNIKTNSYISTEVQNENTLSNSTSFITVDTLPHANPTIKAKTIGRCVQVPEQYRQIAINALSQGSDLTQEYAQINYDQVNYQWYIRFGNLLESINYLLIHNLKGENGINYTELKIDTNSETNLMYYAPNMVSLNPKVCIVQNLEVQKSDGKTDKLFEGINPFKTDLGGSSSYGKIMNIYINMGHVLDLFSQKDKDGNILFMEFLRNLCTDINNSLGKINKLEPKIDPDTNTIKIFDQTPLPEKENLPPNIFTTGSIESVVELYGYNNKDNTSNFIHNVGLTTEITPEFATMITVGATADGYVVGEESTAFSKWNNGIIDRFKESLDFETTPSGSLSEKYLTVIENYYKLFNKTSTSETINWYAYAGIQIAAIENMQNIEVTPDGPKWSPGANPPPSNYNSTIHINENNISTNIDIISEYYKLLQAETVQNDKDQNKSSGQTGFLPFNLQLDMDGISGMKIYQKLEVNSKFLPTNYPEKLEFITTNVDHELKDNKWVTKLNTIATVSNLLSTQQLIDQLKINLNETRDILQSAGRIDDVFRVRKSDYSTAVPSPNTNQYPIIIQKESQKAKYLELFGPNSTYATNSLTKNKTLSSDFNNFVIRKSDDPKANGGQGSYALQFIRKLDRGNRRRYIVIKDESKLPFFGEGVTGQLGNGADIHKKLYQVLIKLLFQVAPKYEDKNIFPIMITGGNDKFHHGKTLSSSAKYPVSNTLPSNTTHTRGLAIDVGSKGSVAKDNEIIKMLYEAGFGAILYHDPPHIHANIDPR